VLIIMIPMLPITVANDLATIKGAYFRRLTGVVWADQALVIIVSGIVFLFAPLVLRYVWHTRVLPRGELRERLETLCRRIHLTYRNILVWESDGMVVNAAVMGLVQPVRYILLSDGLLEMLDDEKIEAVFGHEAGHVKKRHIEFYLLFAIFSMLIVGGVFELVQHLARVYPMYFPRPAALRDYMQLSAMMLIVLAWAVGFGVVSRRFEWQADLFGCRSVTPPAEDCDRPCFVHGTALASRAVLSPLEGFGHAPLGVQRLVPARPAGVDDPVCATAAAIFADALHRIAVLNGIPVEARSWRHSSIANRMRLLTEYARDPSSVTRLERAVLGIKAILLFGTAVGLSIGLWLYWPF
jgi:STE24 endopeptidase